MYNIKLKDTHFDHTKYSTDNQESKYIIWDRNPIVKEDKLVVYTETSMDKMMYERLEKPQTKVGWFLESPVITTSYHEMIKNPKYYMDWDLILTNNRQHIELNPDIFKFSPTGGCWIFPKDQMIYPKTKLLSAIFSDKKYTHGQALRHQIITNFGNHIQTFGRGYSPLTNKIYGLQDYAFQIVIENTKQDYYFSEKLIDCFMTGTIPIYWGCPSIGDFFDIEGMIIFNDIYDMNYIINSISMDMYNKLLDSVKNNFEIAKKYIIAEDYIFKNYLKKYYE